MAHYPYLTIGGGMTADAARGLICRPGPFRAADLAGRLRS
jgi:hypothetical protein